MKKLKLKAFEIGATALLTREQLRNVMGKGSVGQQCSSSPNTPNTCGVDMVCVDSHCAYTTQQCPSGYYFYGGLCHKIV